MPAPLSARRRLAPFAAAVMALAVGIAVGAGPLSDVGTGSDQLASPAAGETLTDASALAGLEAADELAATAAPELYAALPADRASTAGVALVTLPGADGDVVDGLRRQVSATGARVTGTWQVGEELTAPSGKALVDSLGRRLLDQQPNLPVDADAPTYERLGALLGMVVTTTRPEGQDPVPATTTVAETLRTAALVDGPDEARPRAPVVLVVLGTERAADPAADAVLSGLLAGLAERSVGTVVAGTTASGADGTLRRLREDGPAAERGWSGVDGAERVVGQVVAALAVAGAPETTAGDWGTSGADGVVPRPSS